jgi:hypothetical protein
MADAAAAGTENGVDGRRNQPVTAFAPDLATTHGDDEVLVAICDLVAALAANAERIEDTIRRVEAIRGQRAAGLSYRQIETGSPTPLLVELSRQNLAVLTDAASRLRRAETRALYAEGMTMEQIADLFGVTRQRVSALLRARPTRH